MVCPAGRHWDCRPKRADPELTPSVERNVSDSCSVTPPTSFGARFGLLLARLLMGGLFLFSGVAKLGWLLPLARYEALKPLAQLGVDPLAFAGAIKGFQVLHPDLIPFATFAIPWLEVICAIALIFGLGTRGAARMIMFLLVAFCLAMFSVILRDIDVDCTCFGKFLGGKVGWFSIGRNVILLAIIAPVAKYGAGMLAVEHLVASPRRPQAT